MSNNNNNNWKKKVFAAKGGNNRKEILNIQLVNRDKVLLTGPYSMFTEQFKNIIKSCGGTYVTEEKGWMIARSYLNTILTTIQNEKLEIPVNKIPTFVEKILQPFNGVLNYKGKTSSVKIEYDPTDRQKKITDLPESLNQKLYPFQKKGVEFGINNYGRVLIADEMGVGKTIQALSLAYIYKEDWPMLIITPSSLRFNWRDEIFKWIDEVHPYEVQVITKSATEIKASIKALIVSYDLASKMADQIDDFKFKIAIIDEAHYLKNGEAKRTENLLPVIKKCKRCILLTGTPAFARPKELYSLMHTIRPDIFTNFREFGNRYCDPSHNRFSGGLDYNGATNVKELHYILSNSIMIRRLKKDVLTELPPKRRQKIEIKLDNQYVKKIQDAISKSKGGQLSTMIDSMMDTFFHSDSLESEVNKFENDKRNENPEVLQCYLMTGLAKIPGIKEYVSDIAQNDMKFLVFAHHMEVLDAIEDEVKKLKLQYIRIDGKVEVSKRHEQVKAFQEDENVKVGILSLTAAGVGFTLTAASTVIFAEMYWTPAIMLQAEDRIHRMGQKNTVCVNYHYLHGEGTLDSLLYSKLQTKLAIVSEILEGKMEYYDVEEAKDGLGDFTTQEQRTNEKKGKKEDSGKQKQRDSSSSRNSASGMNSITSYFQKRSSPSTQSNGKFESKVVEEKKVEKEEVVVHSDSINWDEIDKLLEEDEKKKQTPQQSKNTRNIMDDIEEEYNDNRMEMRYKNEHKGLQDAKNKGRREQQNYEDKIFHSCLNEILENEKVKRDNENNSRDIRQYFSKDKEPQGENSNSNDLISLWDKEAQIKPKIPVSNTKFQKPDLFFAGIDSTTDHRTPTRTAESSVSKKSTVGSAHKGGFRFSMQPTYNDSQGKNDNKRKRESMVDLDLDEYKDFGVSGHVLKRVKENMPVINEKNID